MVAAAAGSGGGTGGRRCGVPTQLSRAGRGDYLQSRGRRTEQALDTPGAAWPFRRLLGCHMGMVSMIGVLPARLLVASLAAALLTACGAGATATALPAPTLTPAPTLAPPTPPATATPEAVSTAPPLWRYVNSGWGLPRGEGQGGVFTEQLRVFVITSQEALDAFQLAFSLRRSQGTTASLGRVDFPNSILLAAYYLWRPLQGDPLSVVGFSLDGRRAEVQLELEDSPQGKEYPYLLAPMTMVALDRSLFPPGERIEFVFQLSGAPPGAESFATASVTVN